MHNSSAKAFNWARHIRPTSSSRFLALVTADTVPFLPGLSLTRSQSLSYDDCWLAAYVCCARRNKAQRQQTLNDVTELPLPCGCPSPPSMTA